MGQWGMNPWFFGFAGGRSSISRGGNLHQPTCPSHPSHPLPQPPRPPIAPATPATHCPSHPGHPLPQPPQPPRPPQPPQPPIAPATPATPATHCPSHPTAHSPGRPAAQPFQLPFLPSGASLVFLLLFTYAGFTGLYVSVGLLVYMYRWVYWSTFFLGLFKLWLYSRLPLYISCGGFLLLLLVALPFLLTTLEHFSFFTYYSGLFLFLLTALQKVFPVTTYGLFPVTTSGLLPFCFQSTSNILPMYFQCTTVKLLKL